jgi:hypothetical protein
MQRVITIACLLFLAVGWAAWSLRAAASGRVLGYPPAAAPAVTIAAVRRQPGAYGGKTLALTGRMTDRCPSAGCWFYLNDGTGELRVDAGAGRFSVLGVPIGARMTVFGQVICEPGEGPQFVAAGVRL